MRLKHIAAILFSAAALAQGALAQSNPFEQLTPEARFLVELPEGVEAKPDTATLTIGAELNNGEKVAHVSQLVHKAEERRHPWAFAITPEDLAEIEKVLAQTEAWKAEGLHGTSLINMYVSICRTEDTLPDGLKVYFGMIQEDDPDSVIVFGGMTITGPDAEPVFVENGIKPCPTDS
ncbi:hypothetical protein [Halovulum sp. GXIMD14793]